MIITPSRGLEKKALRERLLDALSDTASLLSPATVRAYTTDWKAFQKFCAEQDECDLPASAETVAAFLLHESERGMKAATITRRCAAIAHHHNAAGFNTPTTETLVRRARRVVRRKIGTRKNKKRPLKLEQLKQAVSTLPDTLAGKRDKAILLCGWAGGFRRAELSALATSDLRYVAQGIVVLVPKSKTDQEQAGQVKAIPYGREAGFCPVAALTAWIEAAGITDGPLFRAIDRHGNVSEKAPHPELISEVVKAAAKRIGADAAQFAGHSLRSLTPSGCRFQRGGRRNRCLRDYAHDRPQKPGNGRGIHSRGLALEKQRGHTCRSLNTSYNRMKQCGVAYFLLSLYNQEYKPVHSLRSEHPASLKVYEDSLSTFTCPAEKKEKRVALCIQPTRNLETRRGPTVALDLLDLMLSCRSDREIARMTGLSHITIADYRRRWHQQLELRRTKPDLQPVSDSSCSLFFPKLL